ncbi:MAG: hypothetical protein PHR35_11465 [Kiritimatiellae bacterium]|nr:hypothetical protein [Kiritimatiellia bacterium]
MDSQFDAARWARIADNYGKWWSGELERPLIAVTVGGYKPRCRRPELPVYGFSSFYGLDTPIEKVVDVWQWTLEGQRFLGDAFPTVFPNFGAGVMAAFLGCELHNDVEVSTTWFQPREIRELKDLDLAANNAAPWFRRVRDVVSAADARFGGLAQIGMTDLGGNLDVLASFRPGEQLLLDLFDFPGEVERQTWQVHARWWDYFGWLHAAMPHNRGFTAWTPIFSKEPYYMLQCDFCYMIGPDMFDRFVKPELAASCRRLKNAFYHLDGPGQLPHLDSLLAIPELKGVQWVPGAGQPDITHWPEVYRKIAKAGKHIQFFSGQSERGLETLDVLADQLGSARNLIMIAGVDRKDEARAMRLLERYDALDGCESPSS